jgi:hypothetical protein
MTPLRIFIGFDTSEPAAYHVAAHSILMRASKPIAITPLARWTLRDIFTRERGPLDSTDFAISRFLVPAICGYGGWAIYMDCDMLVRCDIHGLITLARKDRHHALWCVQHDYIPKDTVKFEGHVQTVYPRKNWSSLMVFRNKFCTDLTPEYVQRASGSDLHRFRWLPDDAIGKLPTTYNWLVGEYEANPDAKILHYTRGGPWFREYQQCDHAQEWFDELERAVPSLYATKTVGV